MAFMNLNCKYHFCFCSHFKVFIFSLESFIVLQLVTHFGMLVVNVVNAAVSL